MINQLITNPNKSIKIPKTHAEDVWIIVGVVIF
jgi:hypothetical protein